MTDQQPGKRYDGDFGDRGMALMVPVQKLDEFFNCSICLNHMSGSVMTKCGHRYCGACIREWVDRKHTCPCCNARLESSDFLRDHQYDSLISLVLEEAEKAENNYFQGLIDKVDTEDKKGGALSSPVETVLKKHLKESLARHEKYFMNLKKEFAKKCEHLDELTRKAVEGVDKGGQAADDREARKVALQDAYDKDLEKLKTDMGECEKMVADAYDRYLTNHIPELEILPVKVSIFLMDKNIRVPDFIFKPTESVKAIQEPLEDALMKQGDPIVAWDPSAKIYLFGPLSRQYSEGLQEATLAAILMDNDGFPDVHELAWHSKPIIQHSMKPGSELVVRGCVRCESDLPQTCFSKTFDKSRNGQRMDYYTCNTCNYRWICKPCMQVCHRGHSIAPHVMNHMPHWGCCYCPKKKNCTLQETLTSSEEGASPMEAQASPMEAQASPMEAQASPMEAQA